MDFLLQIYTILISPHFFYGVLCNELQQNDSKQKRSNSLWKRLLSCCGLRFWEQKCWPEVQLETWGQRSWWDDSSGRRCEWRCWTPYSILQSTIRRRLTSCTLPQTQIFYLDSVRPIRTAEDFEAVDWATGFANKRGCIVGLLKETGSVFVKVRTWM